VTAIAAAQILAGFSVGYCLASFSESFLHEYVSDADPRAVEAWRRRPRLYGVLLGTYFSHHVIHHFQTFRKNHITQFESDEHRARVRKALLARGRHGRVIIKGNYANQLHAEGALVFSTPGLLLTLGLGCFVPIDVAIGSGLALALPSAFSYWVHPYLHKPFDDGQKHAPSLLAAFLRTAYGKAMYRNHFMHHHYHGACNFNLVLGADWIRRRVRAPCAGDIAAMAEVGMPLD
jgi:hypothetical protein